MNLENDVIGKYVERLLGLGKSEEEKKRIRNYDGIFAGIRILEQEDK